MLYKLPRYLAHICLPTFLPNVMQHLCSGWVVSHSQTAILFQLRLHKRLLWSSLVPSPSLPLTKWPQKGWSGIFWADSLALAILNNSGQSDSGQSDCRLVTCTQKTCAKLVGTSLTCKRSCLDYGYSTLEIELCTCSAEILDKCLTASMRMLHLDFSITSGR